MSLLPVLKLRLKHLMAVVRRRLIGSHVRALLTSGPNGLLLVATDDFSIGRQLAYGGGCNLEAIQAMRRLLTPDSRVLVIGTHIGTILIPLAKTAYEVVGVEANPETFALLRKNVVLNDLENVRLLPIAASDKNGEVNFLMSRTNSGGSKIQPVKPRFEFSYDSPTDTSVASARLDDVLDGEVFDLILIDIEGSEYFALRGMPNILGKAQNLVIEIIPNHIENVAGISAEAFFTAIPDSFRFARFLNDYSGRVLERAEFIQAIKDMWGEIYFSGCDVVLSRLPGHNLM